MNDKELGKELYSSITLPEEELYSITVPEELYSITLPEEELYSITVPEELYSITLPYEGGNDDSTSEDSNRL